MAGPGRAPSASGRPQRRVCRQAEERAAIRSIVDAVGDDMPVQLGGGIRDLDTIEAYLDDGISYVIIGTAAVKNPGFLHEACTAFPGHIIVGLDAKDGKVAVDGWSKMTGHDVIDLAKKFEDYGVEAVIYTDIGRDGMLSGVNVDATVAWRQACRFRSSPAAASPTSTMSSALRGRRTASWAPSPAARSTRARSISPRRRNLPTNSPAVSVFGVC
jgi:imidazole glycerol phosphate synthase subunit HisF